MTPARNVDEYIAAAAKDARPKLRQVRAAIKEVAPDAVESISYGMPFYSYAGEVGFKNRLVYFGALKSRLVLYMRPHDLEEPADTLAAYRSTKSALWFPLDEAIPDPTDQETRQERCEATRGQRTQDPATSRATIPRSIGPDSSTREASNCSRISVARRPQRRALSPAVRRSWPAGLLLAPAEGEASCAEGVGTRPARFGRS